MGFLGEDVDTYWQNMLKGGCWYASGLVSCGMRRVCRSDCRLRISKQAHQQAVGSACWSSPLKLSFSRQTMLLVNR